MRCNFIGALAFLALAPTALAVQLTITPESSFYVPSSFDGVPELGGTEMSQLVSPTTPTDGSRLFRYPLLYHDALDNALSAIQKD